MGESPEKQNKKLEREVANALSPKGWKERTDHVCKPCWELKYCPYGRLVELFSIGEAEIAKAKELGWYAKLVKGKGWIPCDKNEKGAIPDINRVIIKLGRLNEYECEIFGHTCPVFFVNEPLTETSTFRKVKRNIPHKTFLRVVRRDNQTCQICGKVLKDDEIRIDHIIPFSKGGPRKKAIFVFFVKNATGKKLRTLKSDWRDILYLLSRSFLNRFYSSLTMNFKNVAEQKLEEIF